MLFFICQASGWINVVPKEYMYHSDYMSSYMAPVLWVARVD